MLRISSVATRHSRCKHRFCPRCSRKSLKKKYFSSIILRSHGKVNPINTFATL
ncbi:MAG: hypothetical protein IKP48_05045 [Bacteroidaceae bacterium]|nr:hypothetical protein [Bacteroidaceae bacterium]